MASQLTRNIRRNLTSLFSSTRIRFLSLSAHPKPKPEPEPEPEPTSSPLHFPPTRITTLPNGIRVATQNSPPSATNTASVGIWVDAGSRFEAPGTNGTAHFLEHMIFKGTRRRTAKSLEVEIENMGARLNAYTSREQTTFYADVRSEDVGFAVDVLADILQNSRFPEGAVNKERGVILRELQEVQGQMEEVIFDHLHMAAFQGHPLGDTILGPVENIKSIERDDLRKYISSHYCGHRMVVSAAGAVNHDEIVDMVNNLFKRISRDQTTVDQLVDANPAIFTGSEVRVEDLNIPLVHMAIAFKGASWIDPNSIPLMVIQTLLGSWNRTAGVGTCSGSKLAQRVSTGELAESLMAFNTNYRDTGLFGIYCSASPNCVHDLSTVIMEELRRLAYEVAEDDIIRARNQLKSSLLLHIDGSTAVAENNGRQLLTYGRVMPFLELFARIDAVDAATVKEITRNFIIDKDVAISAVGPLCNLPSHDWFRSQTRDEQTQTV